MMKFCNNHYRDLSECCKKKGMGHLITDDDQKANWKRQQWLKGEGGVKNFDPVIVSMLEVEGKIRQILMGSEVVGCPLCGAMKLLDDERVPDAWIDNVTDVMVIICKVNNLSPSIQ